MIDPGRAIDDDLAVARCDIEVVEGLRRVMPGCRVLHADPEGRVQDGKVSRVTSARSYSAQADLAVVQQDIVKRRCVHIYDWQSPSIVPFGIGPVDGDLNSACDKKRVVALLILDGLVP